MCAILLWSCANAEPTPGAAPAAAERALAPAGRASSTTRIRIPEGAFESGTEPGRHGRNPELEPRLEPVSLGPFEIDVNLFERAPGEPHLGLARGEALDLCRERSGRLCTELEWERACKGPASTTFAGATSAPSECDEAQGGCVSGFAVRSMGRVREWTASDVETGGSTRAVVRGASATAPPDQRRCAHRDVLTGNPGGDIGFRCCYGPPNAARVEVPHLGPTFTRIDLPLARLAELLLSEPPTRQLASDVQYFDDPDASRAVLGKGPGDTKGFLLTAAPLLWNPVPGAEFLVVAARSGVATSFVAAFHVLGKDRYRLASSFVMHGERGPIALAYNGYIRPRLHFSSCWGCAGETGKILYREADQAVILQP